MALYRGNTMIASYGKISGSECRASELSSKIEELAAKIDGMQNDFGLSSQMLAAKIDGLSNDFGLSSQMLSAMIARYGGGGSGITIYQGEPFDMSPVVSNKNIPGGHYLEFKIDSTSYRIQNSDSNIHEFRMTKTLPSNCNWVVAGKSSSPVSVSGTAQYWAGLNPGYANKIGMQFDLTLTKHNILISRSTRFSEWSITPDYYHQFSITPSFGTDLYWLENIENFVVPGGSEIAFTISVSKSAIDYAENFQINYKQLPLMPVY